MDQQRRTSFPTSNLNKLPPTVTGGGKNSLLVTRNDALEGEILFEKTEKAKRIFPSTFILT